MKEPISIKEILAVVIKRGTAVLCTAIALAILLGGFKGIQAMKMAKDPANAPENVAQRNDEAMAEYETQYTILEQSIAYAEYRIQKQQEYLQDSVLMHLDPYGMYKSHVVLAITQIDPGAFQQVYQQEGTPVDYIITQLQQQYLAYWNNLDLENELKNHTYEGVEEKYLRELFKVTCSNGGMLVITAYGETEEAAYSLCQAAYDCILAIRPTIEVSSYAHELKVLSRSTKQEVDYDLEKTQITAQGNVSNYLLELENHRQNMEKLKKPILEIGYSMGTVVKTAVKWAILGGALGFFVACACVWLVYILRDGVETSRQAASVLGVPFLGSTVQNRSIWYRIANWFVGEHRWKGEELAKAYLSENLKDMVSAGETVVVVSTLSIPEEAVSVATVLDVLNIQGCQVCYVNRAEENPELLASLRKYKRVVMAERLGVSARQPMLTVLDMAERFQAEILGFVLV